MLTTYIHLELIIFVFIIYISHEHIKSFQKIISLVL